MPIQEIIKNLLLVDSGADLCVFSGAKGACYGRLCTEH